MIEPFDFSSLEVGNSIMRTRIRLNWRERLVELWNYPLFWKPLGWPCRGYRVETDAELRARILDRIEHSRIEKQKFTCIFKGDNDEG